MSRSWIRCNRWLACAYLLSVLCLVGCEGSTDESSGPQGDLTAQAKAVEAQLNDLLQRERDAFLVVSLPGNALLIQFTGSNEDELAADLPLKWIDDEELEVARKVFTEFGASTSQLPGRDATDLFPSLKAGFGKDTRQAALFTADLLEQVYGVGPDEELVFETELD